MRFINTYLSLLSFAINILHSMLIIGAFSIHEEYIKTEICENRFIENSTCNGQCYLMKKLKSQNSSKETQEEFLILPVIKEFLNPIDYRIAMNAKKRDFNQRVIFGGIDKYSSSVFKPPKNHLA